MAFTALGVNAAPSFPDGTTLRVTEDGAIFRVAGGAPLYVSDASRIGTLSPLVAISRAELDSMPSLPRDGVYIRNRLDDRVYLTVGGAALYLPSWPEGPKETIDVDVASIENAGGSYPWRSLRKQPVDGAFLRDVGDGAIYRIAGGAPIYMPSFEYVGDVSSLNPVNLPSGTIANAGTGGVFAGLNRYPMDGTVLRNPLSGQLYKTYFGTPTPLDPQASLKGISYLDVHPAALANAGTGGVWNHLLPLPANALRGLPYPTRSAYGIKSLQPDFWANPDEIVGNNVGGVSINLVWSSWQTRPTGSYCVAGEVMFEGACFAIDANADQAIREYSQRGRTVTAILYGTPAWAREGKVCEPHDPGFAIFCTPSHPADYARFVRFIAKRYNGKEGHGRVADFVIQNEVNTKVWFNTGCGGSAPACQTDSWIRQYARIYNAAYDAVKAEQSEAKVLVSLEHQFGEVFDTPSAAPTAAAISVKTFLRGFAPKVAPRAWSVAFHAYAPDLRSADISADDYPFVSLGNIGMLVGWLKQAFPGVPSASQVQLTEQGFDSSAPKSDEQRQAAALCQGFRNVLGTPGIDNFVYHRMQDNAFEEGLQLGLRRLDGSAKPAWSVWALSNRIDVQPPILSCGFERLPYTVLTRAYDPSGGKHRASSRQLPKRFNRIEARWNLLREAEAGTKPIYECQSGDHSLLTPLSSCEGLVPLGPVGHVYNDPAAGRVPLYRCYLPSSDDHFVSSDQRCEGHRMESLLGYAHSVAHD